MSESFLSAIVFLLSSIALVQSIQIKSMRKRIDNLENRQTNFN